MKEQIRALAQRLQQSVRDLRLPKSAPHLEALRLLPRLEALKTLPGSAWLRGLRRQRWPRLPGGVRPWVSLLSLGFVLAALVSHGRQLLQFSLDPQGWLWLLLGVLMVDHR